MRARILAVGIAALIVGMGGTAGWGDPPPASQAAPVTGYGPWRFGMSAAEVSQVKESEPYRPVRTTGGLETPAGTFLGEKTNISFIFGAHGLRRIQVWAYEGTDFAAATKMFHSTYKYLSDRFGALRQDDGSVPEGLTLEALRARLPSSFRGASKAVAMDELKAGGSIGAHFEELHLSPQHPPAGGAVFASLVHSPQLGLYYVFVYFDAPAGVS